jgi:hypothetical protein
MIGCGDAWQETEVAIPGKLEALFFAAQCRQR